MAERKAALKRAPERPELMERLRHIKDSFVMTEDLLKEQRASFVYGNAPKGSRITKESALRATNHVRVTDLETAS